MGPGILGQMSGGIAITYSQCLLYTCGGLAIIKNGADSMVMCQLCYEHISSIKIIDHLKAVHHVIDDALYDSKPLMYWYWPALTE